MALLWLGLGILALVSFLVLEGRRQRRSLERRGHRTTGRADLLGIGMLELQGHLQADRDVQELRLELQEDDRLNAEYRPGEVGGTGPGGPPQESHR